jgi:hypothetical protein
MAKRKLTAKLKKQIKETPYRLRQADYSGEALEYLHKVRGARKAAKTKERKKNYQLPRKRTAKSGAPTTPEDIYNALLKESGLTKKQFKKKYPDAETLFQNQKVSGNREVEQLKDDVRFSIPKGASVYINGKRTTRAKAVERLTRLKGRILRTGLTYDRIGVEYTFDAKGNMYLELPTPDEWVKAGKDSDEGTDEESVLDFFEEFHGGKKEFPALHFVRR